VAAADTDAERLRARINALPGIDLVRRAASGANPHLVGGAVRDLLRGDRRVDVDVVVEGDALEVARRLGAGGRPVLHERFGTATVPVDGLTVDLAGARAEAYPRPGALPEVRPGTLAEDLARRDFTVNAMAAPLDGEPDLLDPHGGAEDLAAGILRVLHAGSFSDDPTRALRGARYAARLELRPEPETEALLRRADLGTVSRERVEAELRRVAAEPDPAAVLELIAEWGLLDLGAEDVGLAREALRLLAGDPWRGVAPAGDVLVAVAGRLPADVAALARADIAAPSAGVEIAHGRDGTTLVLARALGGEWLDRYVDAWRHVRLEIGGHDLIEAGIAEGPAVGRGLGAALRAKLDGEAVGREAELSAALAAARDA
jgi:tRNA nucleotidyltransferase (CCA-adding enzyme)